jgi:hypothetical protein
VGLNTDNINVNRMLHRRPDEVEHDPSGRAA